jgi:hypothetical protein
MKEGNMKNLFKLALAFALVISVMLACSPNPENASANESVSEDKASQEEPEEEKEIFYLYHKGTITLPNEEKPCLAYAVICDIKDPDDTNIDQVINDAKNSSARMIAVFPLEKYARLKETSFTPKGLAEIGIDPEILEPGLDQLTAELDSFMEQKGPYYLVADKEKLPGGSGLKIIFRKIRAYVPDGYIGSSSFLTGDNESDFDFVTDDSDLYVQLELDNIYSARNPLIEKITDNMKHLKKGEEELLMLVKDVIQSGKNITVYLRRVEKYGIEVDESGEATFEGYNEFELYKIKNPGVEFEVDSVYSSRKPTLKSVRHLLKPVESIVEKPDLKTE